VGDLRVLRGLEVPPPLVPRDILVHLPAGALDSGRRYPVLYMHDGQNLFDAATSFSGEWQVDETLAALADEGLELIVVGIPNGGDARPDEYSPYPWRGGPREGGGLGYAYVRFLADIVKPAVDAAFPTLPGREATGTMGSSFGGLISLAVAVEAPETFGLIGAMSPSLPPGQELILPLLEALDPAPIRAYVDFGTAEGGPWFERHVGQMVDALGVAGLREPDTLRLVVEEDAIHHESAWARRLPDALLFLYEPFRGAPSSARHEDS
jgi:predicted alpha/beta superfamily hydrolase